MSGSNSFNSYSIPGLNHDLKEDDMDETVGIQEENHFGKGPKGYVPGDERLKGRVLNALFKDRMLIEDDVEVSVADGVVTLTGKVPDRNAKMYAQDVLQNVDGITAIVNRLTLKHDKGLIGDLEWPI